LEDRVGRFAIHANHNIFASVAIHTNGLDFTKNEIINICVLVLDSAFQPSREVKPFWSSMQPRRPRDYDAENLPVPKEEYFKILTESLDADTMADLFEEWWERLGLRRGKKIEPVAYDWARTEPFLTNWLGHLHMKHFFSRNVRDVRAMALLENDKADFHIRQCPFPEPHKLQAVSRASKISRVQPHNVLQDAMVVAGCWRNVLKQGAEVIKVVNDVDNLAGGEVEVSGVWVDGPLDPRS
jgi:hypothetical protein